MLAVWAGNRKWLCDLRRYSTFLWIFPSERVPDMGLLCQPCVHVSRMSRRVRICPSVSFSGSSVFPLFSFVKPSLLFNCDCLDSQTTCAKHILPGDAQGPALALVVVMHASSNAWRPKPLGLKLPHRQTMFSFSFARAQPMFTVSLLQETNLPEPEKDNGLWELHGLQHLALLPRAHEVLRRARP